MNLPIQLTSKPNFVVWKKEKRNGKWTKVPYDAHFPAEHVFAKSNDPATWTSFDVANAAAFDGDFDGIGFMLYGTNLVGIDFDGVVDDGIPEPYVLNIISLIGAPYCEVTPSGTGLRVFIENSVLPPGNRKFAAKKKGADKYGAEIYAGNEGGRYLTLTGDRYSGDGIPQTENLDIVYFLISKFADEHFRRLWMGDSSDYENDESRVDLALLGLFARAFNGDTVKMLRFFNASVPGHREKWVDRADYREMTLAKATSGLSMSSTAWNKFVEQPRKIIEFHTTPTDKQKEYWTPFDYVVRAADGQFDGWFPLGSPSLIGGSSGSGKTTFMLDLCVTQAIGASFYGHQTYKRPYLVLMLDRGKDSHTRTMRRLGFSDNQVPIKFLKAAVDGEASQQIIDLIDQTTPTPELVFIEGIDMLVSDPNALEIVMPFMHEIQQIATHYHVAIVGSCGAPKSKPKEGYAAKRDTIFGSAVWSRMSETIITLQYPDGDDTADKRSVAVLPRNAKAEQFQTEFQHGRLCQLAGIPQDSAQEVAGGRIPKAKQSAINFLYQALQNGPVNGKWVIAQAHELENISRSTLYEAAKEINVNMYPSADSTGRVILWALKPMKETKEKFEPEQMEKSLDWSVSSNEI